MEDIVKLIQEQPDLFVLNGASKEEIDQSEQILGLHFDTNYRRYTATFGAASFAGHELTGVCKSKRLSVVNVTTAERNNTNVPADWYVLEQANIDGIVIWQNSAGAVYQTVPNMNPKKLCESLAEYIEL
ncbi:MAG: SMI1/KNR4 family protein [Monoglobaceae bacterium]